MVYHEYHNPIILPPYIPAIIYKGTSHYSATEVKLVPPSSLTLNITAPGYRKYSLGLSRQHGASWY